MMIHINTLQNIILLRALAEYIPDKGKSILEFPSSPKLKDMTAAYDSAMVTYQYLQKTLRESGGDPDTVINASVGQKLKQIDNLVNDRMGRKRGGSANV